MFKRVFTLNTHLLKDFLITVLKLEMDPNNTNIIIQNSELTKTMKREYRKTVDILILLNDRLTIDVELNSSNYYAIKYRNALYIEKIMTTNLEQGTSLKNMDNYYYYQLNLNIHKFKEDVGEKTFYFKEDKTNELLIENLKVIHKSLDYYYKIYYNKEKKLERDELWLALISSTNISELKEMASLIMVKEDKEKFIHDIEQASKDKLVLSEWESEKMNELVKLKSLEYERNEGFEKGKNEGFEKGKSEGFEEGIKKGRSKGIEETIKAMSKENFDINTISRITNKTKEEIEIILNNKKS